MTTDHRKIANVMKDKTLKGNKKIIITKLNLVYFWFVCKKNNPVKCEIKTFPIKHKKCFFLFQENFKSSIKIINIVFIFIKLYRFITKLMK